MARVRAELVEGLRRLPTGAFRDPSHAYPLVDWFPVSGWTHEQGHMSEVRHWWGARRGQLRRR
jgi:hypothetical protein